MTTVWYDGSFDGLLSAIFDIYERKIQSPDIRIYGTSDRSLFHSVFESSPTLEKANRVNTKLRQSLSTETLKAVYASFLSGNDGIENVIYEFVRYILAGKVGADKDYSNGSVLAIHQISRQVYRERHRMEAFIRFRLTGDGLYYALIEPDFDVIPLLLKHFETRYADQCWLIYDTRRNYGVYFNKQETEEVVMDVKHLTRLHHNQPLNDGILHQDELLFQKLWRHYFDSVNIKARKNTRLHVQHMPRRYWKYLTEKI